MEAIFESEKTEFIYFVQGLINDALMPYKHQIKGKIDLPEIENCCSEALAQTRYIKGIAGEKQCGGRYGEKRTTKEVCSELAKDIDTAILGIFKSSMLNKYYLLDFNSLSRDIHEKMEALVGKA